MSAHSFIMLATFTIPFLTAQAQGPYVKHIPARAIVSGFQEANEFKLTTFCQTGIPDLRHGAFRGGIEASFAPANHLSVSIGVTTRSDDKRSPIGETGTNYRYGSTLQLSVGGFTTIGKFGRLELAAGFATGKVRGERWQAIGIDSTPSVLNAFFSLLSLGLMPVTDWEYFTVYDHHYYTVNYTDYFIQPSIGVGNDYATALVGARLSTLKYQKFRTDDDDYFSAEQAAIDEFVGKRHILVQPFVHLEAGGRYVKINTQVGLSLTDGGIGPSGYYGSVGLTVHIAPRFTENRWY